MFGYTYQSSSILLSVLSHLTSFVALLAFRILRVALRVFLAYLLFLVILTVIALILQTVGTQHSTESFLLAGTFIPSPVPLLFYRVALFAGLSITGGILLATRSTHSIYSSGTDLNTEPQLFLDFNLLDHLFITLVDTILSGLHCLHSKTHTRYLSEH